MSIVIDGLILLSLNLSFWIVIIIGGQIQHLGIDAILAFSVAAVFFNIISWLHFNGWRKGSSPAPWAE